MQVPVVAELQEQGIFFEATAEDYVKVHCVFHDDNTPSASINTATGRFQCFACGKNADFVSFLAAKHQRPPSVIKKSLEKRYGADNDKTIPIERIERLHQELFKPDNAHLLGELHKRKVPDEVLRARRIGIDGNRITIPIFNANNYVVNVRSYRPGAAKGKFTNARGHGKPIRLYPLDQLSYKKIALCGGEVKALAAIPVLNAVGYGAIAPTGGETNWALKLSEKFRDKTVFICMDVDEAGQKGAEQLALYLHQHAREVYIVKLPVDRDKYPHGDVNDFLAEGGNLPKLLAEVESGAAWEPPKQFSPDDAEEAKRVTLGESVHGYNAGKRIKTTCTIAAIAEQPYSVPAKVVVNCDRSEEVCALCGVFAQPADAEYPLHPENPALLELVEVSKKQMQVGLMGAVGIPERCRKCTFTITEHCNVEDVRLAPQLEISDRADQRELVAAYIVADHVTLNESYHVEGRMHPHPASQASTLLISNSKEAQDTLSLFKLDEPRELRVFQPHSWDMESLKQQMNCIYRDLESNVTHIFSRRWMHLAIDLTYHSPLTINLRGTSYKGWVESLILGDSAQGKTEASTRMMHHYRLGERVDCKNASVAGLLGGLSQMGGNAKKWFARWGVIPMHDRRLVILEELKGMQPELIAKLTDMRSSGIAELPKIEKRRTHARTRLLALSNPRSPRPLSTYAYGVEAVRELIGSAEDVRRFDLVCMVSAAEISARTISQLQMRQVDADHIFNGRLCRKLILWAWTRTEEQVVFEDERYVIQKSIELADRFSDEIPIVDRGSIRLKLARLAASLAARTFSNHEYHTLFVRNVHVDFICEYLTRMYTAPAFGYDAYTTARQQTENLLKEAEVKHIVNHTPHPESFARNLLNKAGYDLQDFMDWTGMDRDMVQSIVSQLCLNHAIQRRAGKYYSAPAFLTLCRRMIEDDDFGDRPEYFKDEEF